MPRSPRYPPLEVRLNGRLVGHLTKAASGALSFRYHLDWLEWDHTLPVSISLPLREDPYQGDDVSAVFENLLPDLRSLRHRIAERVGATGTDAFSLLSAIGSDCVGALQFVIEGEAASRDKEISGEEVSEAEIEGVLRGLRQTPLGLRRSDDFRISVAGVQEKTALLFKEGKWIRPHGTTPTTHILKPPIGQLPNGIDLTDSVENEFYCLRLAAAFGLPVNEARIHRFGETDALVVERFDRRWTDDGRLIRLPQEDLCQALGVDPGQKYQSDGGPGIVDVLGLLEGSDIPEEDQATILTAQIFFWLIGATDGHAKNFSIAIGPGGTYRLTPLYDILTAQPALDNGQIGRKDFRLAMSAGRNRHYRIHDIARRHFVQTAEEAKLPPGKATDLIDSAIERARRAVVAVETDIASGIAERIHESVKGGIEKRIRLLRE